mgnify:CR=1 FL=1
MLTEESHEMTLYSTTACHLCEQAQLLLDRIVSDTARVTYHITDISDSDLLFERYGWHIPVLRFADGHELYWPFDEASIRERLLRA